MSNYNSNEGPREDSTNNQSTNPNMNADQNSHNGFNGGAQPGYDYGEYQGTGYQGPSEPVGAQTINSFFTWVRDSYLRRSDNRWIGGVCGGLAERLGWSPALIRVIMLICILCFGAGGIFYAIAWLILPDSNNVIIGEDVLAGQWRVSMIGILFLLIGSLSYSLFSLFAACIVAVAALWILMQWSRGQARAYGFGRNSSIPSDNTHPFSGGGWQGADPAAFTSSPVQNEHFSAASDRETNWQGPGAANSFRGNQSGFTSWQGQNFAQHNQFAHPYRKERVRRIRRKPAGPVWVLISLGVVILSGVAVSSLGFSSATPISLVLQMWLIWIGALSLLLGGLLIYLAARGRRSGGLIPIALLIVIVMAFVLTGTVTTYFTRDKIRQNYETVALTEGQTMNLGSQPTQLERYENGILFTGSPSKVGNVSIDLSQYQKDNGIHEVWMTDGSRQNSGCPTGDIRIGAMATNVVLQLPKGCTFVLSKFPISGILSDIRSDSSDWRKGIGWQFGFDNHRGYFNVEGYGKDRRWPSRPELFITFTHGDDSRLTITRKGTATLPQEGQHNSDLDNKGWYLDKDEDDNE